MGGWERILSWYDSKFQEGVAAMSAFAAKTQDDDVAAARAKLAAMRQSLAGLKQHQVLGWDAEMNGMAQNLH